MIKYHRIRILMIIASLILCSCSKNEATGHEASTPVPSTSETISTATLQPSPVATVLASPETGIPNTWMKTYGTNQDDTVEDIQVVEDGSYYLAGSTNIQFETGGLGNAYLLHIGATGEVLWEQVYESYNSAQAISPLDNGGLLISGVTSSNAGDRDIFVAKLDQDGNETWSKTLGGPLDEFGAAWFMPDGGYLLGGNIVDPKDIVVDDPGVTGYGGFAGRSNIFLTRIDAEGNELWSHTFGGENNVITLSGVRAVDEGFLILGTVMYYPEHDDDIYLLKVDKNGDEAWSRTWEEGNLDANEIIQTSDGNYLIAGGYAPAGDPDTVKKDFMFLKVDPDGNEIWKSIFGDPGVFDWAYAVAETPDGGYITLGDISKDLNAWESDIILAKIDAKGQVIWKKTIETNTHTMLSKILVHQDGGYMIIGSTYRRGGFDILLIKTDAEGNFNQ